MDQLQGTKLRYARGIAQHANRLPDGFDVERLYRVVSYHLRQETIANEEEDAELRIFLGAIATIDTIDPDTHFGRSLTHALGMAARNMPAEAYAAPGVATPIRPLIRIREAQEGDYNLRGFTFQLLHTALGHEADQAGGAP